jgi:release factor glutamine methyltransferase
VVTRTPLTLARLAAERLQREGIADPRLEAELLLAGVLGVRRLDLYLQYDRPLTPEEVDAYRSSIRRRLRREPLQYILGKTEFRDLTLRVDARALIPRPETEVLVDTVIAWIDGHASASARERGLDIADIGTGTGAIGLSLARQPHVRRVVLTDASPSALQLAAENAAANGLGERVELRAGALFEPLREGESYDIIVSNPPYVAESQRSSLQPEVRDWEPALALFAGPDGMKVLNVLVDGAWRRLKPGGLLALELGLGQAASVAGRIRALHAYTEPAVARDLVGRERIILATRIAKSGEAVNHA